MDFLGKSMPTVFFYYFRHSGSFLFQLQSSLIVVVILISMLTHPNYF